MYHFQQITIYTSALMQQQPQKVSHFMAHEMGHHLWSHLSKGARQFWDAAIRQDYGPIDVASLLADWTDESMWAFEFVTYMRDKDPTLALQVDTAWQGWRGQSKLTKREDFARLLEQGETTVNVPKTPITGYAGKSPEEAFCEAIGMLVGYGPRAVHERVRHWLKITIPGMAKMAERSVEHEFAEDFFRRYPKLRRYAPKQVVDKPSGPGEARQHGDEIWLFPKFWKLDPRTRDFVFAHELGHFVLGKFGMAKYVQLAGELGIDVWDQLSLPFGQHNMDEAFADSFASYHLTPSELKSRYPAWVDLVQRVKVAKIPERVAARWMSQHPRPSRSSSRPSSR